LALLGSKQSKPCLPQEETLTSLLDSFFRNNLTHRRSKEKISNISPFIKLGLSVFVFVFVFSFIQQITL